MIGRRCVSARTVRERQRKDTYAYGLWWSMRVVRNNHLHTYGSVRNAIDDKFLVQWSTLAERKKNPGKKFLVLSTTTAFNVRRYQTDEPNLHRMIQFFFLVCITWLFISGKHVARASHIHFKPSTPYDANLCPHTLHLHLWSALIFIDHLISPLSPAKRAVAYMLLRCVQRCMVPWWDDTCKAAVFLWTCASYGRCTWLSLNKFSETQHT